jgi:hypothetical protein
VATSASPTIGVETSSSTIAPPVVEVDRVAEYLGYVKVYSDMLAPLSERIFVEDSDDDVEPLVLQPVGVDGEMFMPVMKDSSSLVVDVFSLGPNFELYLFAIETLSSPREWYYKEYFVNGHALMAALNGTNLAAEQIAPERVSLEPLQRDLSSMYVSTHSGESALEALTAANRSEVYGVAAETLKKMEQLHEIGFVHRYINIENLMVRPNVLFSDLGYASLYVDPITREHVEEAEATYPRNSWVAGYMSPWQLYAKTSSRRDDVFALADLLVTVFGDYAGPGMIREDLAEQKLNDRDLDGVPAVVVAFYKYAITLNFLDRPDYATWVDKFERNM